MERKRADRISQVPQVGMTTSNPATRYFFQNLKNRPQVFLKKVHGQTYSRSRSAFLLLRRKPSTENRFSL
jgi:hypothetical protein